MTTLMNEEALWKNLELALAQGKLDSVSDHDLDLACDPEYVFESLRAALAEDLYKAMQAAGLSESDLAKQMGVSRQAVNEVFQTQTNMSFKTLAKFCVALGVRPALSLMAPGDQLSVTHALPPKIHTFGQGSSALAPWMSGEEYPVAPLAPPSDTQKNANEGKLAA